MTTTVSVPLAPYFVPAAPTVSMAVAEALRARTGHLFGLMGNGNAHLISHLTRAGFPYTSARHEAATVTMADAYHRSTGLIGHSNQSHACLPWVATTLQRPRN
ncbi:thiamine pyrophosphate-binding protein [Arthrobacter sp. ISL-95]|uniref:thiamine pyrophosphate-binding protein n=1 Tax=Arthrobacter sp. ISL-95 TaxID=2819116 RepID=UPI002852E5D8|nr:thiamine pyrophosphate-binding protein [Arthrobacter sp. ISL-95]